MIRERRAFELRSESDGNVLFGIAMPYGSRGQVGKFSEEFAPGSLSYEDVLVNVLHNPSRIVARTGAGLTLSESNQALEARIELPDTTEGRDAAVNVSSGIYRGISIEFFAKRDEWRGTHRIVLEAVTDAISIVARPAYAGATIGRAGEMRSEDHLAGACPYWDRFRKEISDVPLRKGIRRWRYL